ncbi:diaminopimelate dehydrogenase [Trueperella sp. LYQ143]|uniref:diaminopimelate dehydrogenase n=1 Tax=unclassified Trueperella TaxID=2630174 RepID=UPI003983547C
MIRVAINGYGNLGRGVELAISKCADMECVAVFTRRDPQTLTTLGAPAVPLADVEKWRGKIDVVINCGGSATDLIDQGPQIAQWFSCVDSFDTHAKIPQHFSAMDEVARQAGTLALISSGWDPGLFSMIRVLADAVLPGGTATTFWGPGVSQGHSDAIRRIEGVQDAKQYTVPIDAAVETVKSGGSVNVPRQMHTRECFVVAEDGADRDAITQAIVTMPNYFADYDTTVTFVTPEEFARDHSGMPHGGKVIHVGSTSEHRHSVVFDLQLDSNPEFTGSVLVASARAVARMAGRGNTGAITMMDVTLGDLSPRDNSELRAHFL